jgi:pyruvate dehydrogenase E2 component (dihydrolipoamide acetyltransferase)
MFEFRISKDDWPADPGTEGIIAEWKVSVRDFVNKDDLLFESVFVKTNIEILSPVSGTIKEICIKKNELFKQDTIIVIIDDNTDVSDVLTSDNDAENKEPNETYEIETGLTVLEKKSISGIRKTISNRMTASWLNAPQVTEFINVNMDSLVALRKGKNDKSDNNINIGYEDFIIKALALGLEGNRDFNGSIINDEIMIFGEINIGCAIDTQDGLMVPVIKGSNQKSIYEISELRQKLTKKANAGELLSEDINQGTASISNLGSTGIDSFTPILNPPQICILGIGAISKQVQVINDDFSIHQIARLCLTFDHRAVDGFPAANFLISIKEKLEVPDQLL